MLNILSN